VVERLKNCPGVALTASGHGCLLWGRYEGREGVVRRELVKRFGVRRGRANNDLHASEHCRACGAFSCVVVVERRSCDNINIR
jgi:hypothetical protein